MPVPDFQSLMLSVLKALSDGNEFQVAEVCTRVAAAEGLTPDDLSERTRGDSRTKLETHPLSKRRSGRVPCARRGPRLRGHGGTQRVRPAPTTPATQRPCPFRRSRPCGSCHPWRSRHRARSTPRPAPTRRPCRLMPRPSRASSPARGPGQGGDGTGGFRVVHTGQICARNTKNRTVS